MDRGLLARPSPNYDAITVAEDKGRNNGYGRSTAETGKVATSKSATQTEEILKGFRKDDRSKRNFSSGST
jgi:hypothetical protein